MKVSISADHINSTKPFSSADENPTSDVQKYSSAIKWCPETKILQTKALV